MGDTKSCAKIAFEMGRAGQDNRILMQPNGDYTHVRDDPPEFTREDIAQHDAGTYVFSFWEQATDQDPRLNLVFEVIHCQARDSEQIAIPMHRPKPKRYPALMKKAGEPVIRKAPPVPAIQSPRYADYDLVKFTRWVEWQVGGHAALENREEMSRLAGFAWIDGDRVSKWTHARSRSETFPATESGVRMQADEELAGRGARKGDSVVVPALLALWWPVPGGATVVCTEPDTGNTLTSTLLASPHSGLFARVAGGHTITFTDWR